MSGLPVIGLVSHTRHVQSIYKRVLRNLQVYYRRRHLYRYEAVLMREEFDKNKCITDNEKIKKLLEKAEKDLFQMQHWHLRAYTDSPGGTNFERVVEPPDWVLDGWHPLEKAAYPDYFTRREERKKEFLKQWKKTYANN